MVLPDQAMRKTRRGLYAVNKSQAMMPSVMDPLALTHCGFSMPTSAALADAQEINSGYRSSHSGAS